MMMMMMMMVMTMMMMMTTKKKTNRQIDGGRTCGRPDRQTEKHKRQKERMPENAQTDILDLASPSITVVKRPWERSQTLTSQAAKLVARTQPETGELMRSSLGSATQPTAFGLKQVTGHKATMTVPKTAL